MESRVAKYPRIVIDNEIIKKINKDSKTHIFRQHLKKIFVKDWVGTTFINPFKLVESFSKLMLKIPDALDIVHLIKDNQKIKDLNIDKDIADSDFSELVWNNVRIKLVKYKDNPELYEKYLWLKEFLDWNDKYLSYIEFRYLYK